MFNFVFLIFVFSIFLFSIFLNIINIIELLAIRQMSRLSNFWEATRLFCFVSMSKFANFKNPFAKITSLSKLHFRWRRFILFVQMKEIVFMSYGSNARSWKPWEWGFTWYSQWEIYTSVSTLILSQNSAPVAEAPSLKISIHITSLKWSERLS